MSIEWGTPAALFAALNREFAFTLDAAASAENAKLPVYFTRETSGLRQSWGTEVVWLNPPYGDANLWVWIQKAWAASQEGATVVCLVPVNASSRWWNDYAPRASEIRWIRGRLRFEGAASTAPFASAILVFRPPVKSLAARDIARGVVR